MSKRHYFSGRDQHTSVNQSRWLSLAICGIFLTLGTASIAKDAEEPAAKAPPNHAILKNARGGVYYVAKPLKARYDTIREQLSILNADLKANKINARQTLPKLDELQKELVQLRKEIEEKKILVSPMSIHEQDETTLFELGPNHLLVITTDQIQLQSWEGTKVKCVLTKNVLVPAGEKPDEHLKGMRVVHQHGNATEIVGRTNAEIDADEQKYRNSPDGQKRTPEQLAQRSKFVQEVAEGYRDYEQFQGREIDRLQIEGLTHDQGNRSISIRTESVGGDGNLWSEWQRHAKLTVFLPAGCRAVAVRGCQVGIDVHDVKSTLVLTNHDSQDRDYNGRFEVRGVQGSVRIRNIPVQLIENVQGDVTITATEEFANTGTTHEDGMRVAYVPAANQCSLKHIQGNLTAWFSRSNLTLEDVSGKIDVRNDFGDTALMAKNVLQTQSHRIVSLSGDIDVRCSASLAHALKFLAVTNHGKVITNFPQSSLENISFATHDAEIQSRRNWRGMMSVKANGGDPDAFFSRLNRPNDALRDAMRTPGLDLISRAGEVKLMRQND